MPEFTKIAVDGLLRMRQQLLKTASLEKRAQVAELLAEVRRYGFTVPEGYEIPDAKEFYHPSVIRNRAELFSFLPPAEVERTLRRLQVPYGEFTSEQVTSLEDAFIGLTGKY